MGRPIGASLLLAPIGQAFWAPCSYLRPWVPTKGTGQLLVEVVRETRSIARLLHLLTCPQSEVLPEREKKGTGQLFCEPIDGTCSGVLAYAATNTVDLSLTESSLPIIDLS